MGVIASQVMINQFNDLKLVYFWVYLIDNLFI